MIPFPLPRALARLHTLIEGHQEQHEKGFFLAEQDRVGQARAQPVLMYVTPASLRGERGGGPHVPDWLGEVLEEGAASERMARYARAGVGEYWLIYPGRIEVHREPLAEGAYAQRAVFSGEEPVASDLFPGLTVRPNDLG